MAFLTFFGCVALLTMFVIAGWRALVAGGDQLFTCWRRMTPFGRIVALLAVGVSILYGGGKTNDAARAISQTPRRGASSADSQMVARARNWNIRGAWDDSFDLTFTNGFLFPFGTNRLTSIEVFSQGYFRPSLPLASSPDPSHLPPRTSYLLPRTFPLVPSPSSLLSLIPNHSSFSYEHTPSNSYRFAWENVPFGRIPLGNLDAATNNFSLELFRNGDTLVVSNGVATLHPRMLPFDWDADGLLNEKDARPTIPDGDFFGADNALPEGANSNNYCWVDITVSDAVARVTFAGDAPSALPDPDFVARPGETYRVVLLIGKTYTVFCDEEVAVTAKSSEEISVITDSGGNLQIVWPVSYEIVSAARSLSKSIRMLPPRLRGTFSWGRTSCCAWLTDDSPVIPVCADGCRCGGCTRGEFTFLYEGYSLLFEGIPCGCVEGANPEEENAPSLNVSFSEDALFYEEAYTNAPGDVVARRHSTNVAIRVSASGGPCGGVFTLTRTGLDKLSFVEGDPLPEEIITLAPNETRSWRAEYAPRVHSATKDDVTLSARFEEYLTANTLSDEDKMTVVKLVIEPWIGKEGCVNRHLIGVRENLNCYAYPDVGEWNESGSGRFEDEVTYVAPLISDESAIRYVVDGSQYDLDLTIIEPMAVIARLPVAKNFCLGKNVAGGAGMNFQIYVLPENVSFSGVAMEEVPSNQGVHIGYFANVFFKNVWYHTVTMGAGIWRNIGVDNYWGEDKAWMGDRLPREKSNGEMANNSAEGCWSEGMMVWYIEWGWSEHNTESGYPPIRTLSTRYDQTFTMDQFGTLSVMKFGNTVSRGTNDVIRLNDVVVVGEF